MSKYISVKVVDVDTTKRITKNGKECYAVTYPGGYRSLVPCEVFEQGKYVPVLDSDMDLLTSDTDINIE